MRFQVPPKTFRLDGGGAEIARPDKTAPDQTARLNNGDHEQSSPLRIIAMRVSVMEGECPVCRSEITIVVRIFS